MHEPDETQRALMIGEQLLDLTRTALLERDFAAFERAFLLPHVHTTMEGTTVLETREDLRVLFDRVTSEYRRLGVDEFFRVLVSARFAAPHVIEARSVTHLLSGGTRVFPPYAVQSELVLCGKEWRIASANYSVGIPGDRVAAALMPDAFPSECARKHQDRSHSRGIARSDAHRSTKAPSRPEHGPSDKT